MQRLMETHYVAVQGQVRQTKQWQEVLDKQMEQIVSFAAEPLPPEYRSKRAEQVSHYLKQLKSQYSQIRAGIYSGSWKAVRSASHVEGAKPSDG